MGILGKVMGMAQIKAAAELLMSNDSQAAAETLDSMTDRDMMRVKAYLQDLAWRAGSMGRYLEMTASERFDLDAYKKEAKELGKDAQETGMARLSLDDNELSVLLEVAHNAGAGTDVHQTLLSEWYAGYDWSAAHTGREG